MAKHRAHIDRVQAAGRPGVPGRRATHALARRHGISRNLIKIWVAKYEAGELDSDAAAADVFTNYEARFAALERLVGQARA